jgi:hypothetical protein
MGRKKEYLILNYDEVDLNSIILGILKYDEDRAKHYIEIRYKQDTKKSLFYIQSPKVLLEKLSYMNLYEDNIIDVKNKDNIFTKFIRKIELYIVNIITDSFNNKKINLNYKNQHKLQEYFKSNILINDNIRMKCNYNEVLYFNYNKTELSFDDFLSKLNDNTYIYIIFNINNILFENKFYYIEYELKQIQICKTRNKVIDRISNYQFLLNETVLETGMNESYIKPDNPKLKHNLSFTEDTKKGVEEEEEKVYLVEEDKICQDDNIIETDSDNEIDIKLLEKNNLIHKIMEDLDSSS